jgi:hypothetical protein
MEMFLNFIGGIVEFIVIGIVFIIAILAITSRGDNKRESRY